MKEEKKTSRDMIDMDDMMDLLEAGSETGAQKRTATKKSPQGSKKKHHSSQTQARKNPSSASGSRRLGSRPKNAKNGAKKKSPPKNGGSSGSGRFGFLSSIPPTHIHIAFGVFVLLIAAIGIFKLSRWTKSGEYQYDPNDTSTEFDTESEDFLIPLNSAMAGLQKDDGVNTILLLGNGALAKTKGQEDGIGMRLESFTGGKVYDASLDHTYLSVKNTTYDDSYPADVFSLYWLSYCISTGDYTLLRDTAQTWDGDSTVQDTVAMLENLDMSAVDTLVIMYDSHDYEDKRILAGPYDESMAATCCGCLLQSIRLLQDAYPHIRIIVSSPFFNYIEDDDQKLQPGSIYNMGQGTLADYMVAYKNIAVECGVSFIDNYFGTITESNYESYLEDDKEHLSSEGREAIARRIASFIGTGGQNTAS